MTTRSKKSFEYDALGLARNFRRTTHMNIAMDRDGMSFAIASNNFALPSDGRSRMFILRGWPRLKLPIL